MGIWSGLKTWGCRLGLIRIVGAGPETPPKILPQVTSIKDLMAEGRGAGEAIADLPGELSAPFEQVFQAAGVASAGKAWSMDRFCGLLQGDAGPDGSKVREVVLRGLAAENASVQDLVADSRSRDRVLGDLERRLLAAVEQRSQARQRKRAQIDRQMADLQETRTRLQAEDEQDQQQMRAWRQRKSVYQNQMRGVIQALSENYGTERPANRSCP